jgi:hypothetical protein
LWGRGGQQRRVYGDEKEEKEEKGEISRRAPPPPISNTCDDCTARLPPFVTTLTLFLLTQSRRLQKKKKAGGTEDPTHTTDPAAATPPLPPAERAAADQRFNSAVSQLAADSDNALWIKLDGIHLTDGKITRLAAALQKSTHVLSLDLAKNALTGRGIAKLAAALEAGAAPDLIELKIYGNSIGEEGREALGALRRARKSIRVEDEEPASADGSAGGGKDGPSSSSSSSQGSMGRGLASNRMVRQYFQMGGDAEDEEESEEQAKGEADEDAGPSAEELSPLLWGQASFLYT